MQHYKHKHGRGVVIRLEAIIRDNMVWVIMSLAHMGDKGG